MKSIRYKKAVMLLLAFCLIFTYTAPCEASAEEYCGGLTLVPLSREEAEDLRVTALENREMLIASQMPQVYKNSARGENLYYYNRMSEGEKTLYDNLTASCEMLLRSDADIKKGDSGYYAADYVTLSEPVSVSSFEKMVYAVYYSNPQYFFFYSFAYGYDESGRVTCAAPLVRESYAKGGERLETAEKINAAAEVMLKGVSGTDLTDLEKEKLIAQRLCETITYSFTADDRDQTLAGALIDKKCVCNGYAMAMTYLCNAAGVDCITVKGDNHAWNIVSIGGKRYETDVTWMDRTEDTDVYIDSAWLNKSRASFLKNDKDGSHRIDGIHSGILALPDCSEDQPLCSSHVWTGFADIPSAAGYRLCSCRACPEYEAVSVCADNAHLWQDGFRYDESCHWKFCSVCGSASEKEAHRFVKGVCQCGFVVKAAGDIDGSGGTDNADLLLLRYVLSTGEAEKYPFADADGDGHIDNADLLYLRFILSRM